MSELKKYEPYKIPARRQPQENAEAYTSEKTNIRSYALSENKKFAEIIIEDPSNNCSAEAVPASQATVPIIDEKREVFMMMRQIARDNHFQRINHAKIYSNPDQQIILSVIFYKQAMFMKDFEDDFNEQFPFSSYYPYYQLLSYEQLRTYFTWRTNIRKGIINDINLSYAYIYVYELLNNIGINEPQDGLDRLMAFRRAFIKYNASIDKYLLKWIKDYHIYYDLPKSFNEFIHENNIYAHYDTPVGNMADIDDYFGLFSGASRYDIKRSAFYSAKNADLISGCFNFTIGRLMQLYASADISFDGLIFQPPDRKYAWSPFGGALFFSWRNQPDKRIMLSESEIYICYQNKWSCSSVKECNKALIGYIMKKMESALRKITNFKYKLIANINMIDQPTFKRLNEAGIPLEQAIDDAVSDYYIDINRKIVKVDEAVLMKIRREALLTQEKLIVQDNTYVEAGVPLPVSQTPQEINVNTDIQTSDEWTSLSGALTKVEREALSVILQEGGIKGFADANGVMLEVLIDSINQKAFDILNDNVLESEDSITVYPEYINKLTEMVMS